MARARNIKPSFFINDELVELPFATRLLFIGLWTLSDREGRLEDKPKKIKMALFPADDLDVNNALNELDKSGFIQRYTINEIQYIQILAFTKHQNPHIKEPASTIPAPCLHHAETVRAVLIPDSPLPITDSLNLIPVQKPSRINPLDDDFSQFWNRYPKKVGKDKALIAWKKKKPNVGEVLNALSWQVQCDQWQKDSGQFIPNPATYLNEGRWQDEQPRDSFSNWLNPEIELEVIHG